MTRRRRLVPLLVLTAAITLLPAAPAGAALRGDVIELGSELLELDDMAFAADGNAYAVDDIDVWRIEPSGRFSRFDYGARPGGLSSAQVEGGTDGQLWIAGSGDTAARIIRRSLRTRRAIIRRTSRLLIEDLEVLNGSTWALDVGDLARLPSTGRPSLRPFRGPRRPELFAFNPDDAVPGADGAFYTFDKTRLVRISQQGTPTVTRTGVPETVSYYYAGIGTDSTGRLWFSPDPRELWHPRPDGSFLKLTIPQSAIGPEDCGSRNVDRIAPGPDGAAWFLASRDCGTRFVTHAGLVLGRIDPATNQITLHDLGIDTQTLYKPVLKASPDGRLWLMVDGRIFRITIPGATRGPKPRLALPASVRRVGPQDKTALVRRPSYAAKLGCTGPIGRYCTGTLRVPGRTNPVRYAVPAGTRAMHQSTIIYLTDRRRPSGRRRERLEARTPGGKSIRSRSVRIER